MAELSTQLGALLLTQRTAIEARLDEISNQLDKSWNQVAEWRLALGDTAKDSRGTGPLESEVAKVEAVLGGMRGRMSERGVLVVEVQKRLAGMREWIEPELELEDWEAGWEGLDLRLSRLEALQKELGRCEAEVVSACPAKHSLPCYR